MSKIIKLQSYRQSQRPVHKATTNAAGIVEYLDDFSERCKAFTKGLNDDIAFLRRHKAELVGKH